MRLCQEVTLDILDQISITNREWHTQDSQRGVGTYVIRSSTDHRLVDHNMEQELVQLITEIGLLTQQFTIMNSKKVNAEGALYATFRVYESNLEEEAKYLDREQAGFQVHGKEIEVETIIVIDTGTVVGSKIVTGEKKMTIKRRDRGTFNQAVGT